MGSSFRDYITRDVRIQTMAGVDSSAIQTLAPLFRHQQFLVDSKKVWPFVDRWRLCPSDGVLAGMLRILGSPLTSAGGTSSSLAFNNTYHPQSLRIEHDSYSELPQLRHNVDTPCTPNHAHLTSPPSRKHTTSNDEPPGTNIHKH